MVRSGIGYSGIFSFDWNGGMKKRILFFTNCFIFGGCENVLVNLINSPQLKKEWDIHYAYGYNKEYDKGVKLNFSESVRKYPLPLLENVPVFYRLNLINNKTLFQKVIIFFIKVILTILRVIGIYSLWNIIVIFVLFKIVKPDILFINNGGYPAALACRNAVYSAKIAGIRKILFNVNNLALKRNGFIAKREDEFIRNNVSYFITASLTAKMKLIENIGISEEKTIQVYNTSKELKANKHRNDLLTEYQIPKDKFIITEVGLLTERKGQIYILRALKNIKEKNKDVFERIIVFLVGEGEDRTKLENYIKENGLDKNVILTGHRDDDTDFINAADIFVLPSNGSEDMPYVILYAMSLKKAIIATKSAGIVEEIRDGIDGILLDINEREKLSDSIIELINNKDMREYYAGNAYTRFIDYFSFEKIISKYINIFNSLLIKKH